MSICNDLPFSGDQYDLTYPPQLLAYTESHQVSLSIVLMKSVQLSHVYTEEPLFHPRVTEYSQSEFFQGNMNHGNEKRILHKYSQSVPIPKPDFPSLGSSSVSEIQ